VADCPPLEPGLIDFVYDLMPDGQAVAFDHYALRDYQYAAVRAEMTELTYVLDPRQPPWGADKTRSPGVFRRRIQYYGTIWYTLGLIGGRRRLVILTGTFEDVDNRSSEIRMARQEAAERRVDQIRREGWLCSDAAV
jgi:hypothetical protein